MSGGTDHLQLQQRAISENIITESNINSLIKDILEIINKAEFKQPIISNIDYLK